MKNQNIRPKALVVGDVMLDHSIFGSATRLTPEGPVPVIVKNRVEDSLGGAGFVSKVLSDLDIEVTLASVLGVDDSSATIMDCCKFDGIDSSQILMDQSLVTSKKTRIYASGHLVARLDDEDKYEMTSSVKDQLLNSLTSLFKHQDFKVCIISDYNKGFCNEYFIAELIKICKTNNIITLVDPKTEDVEKFRGCDLIKPNDNEAAKILGVTIDALPDPKIVVETISRTLDIPNVLYTRGSQGMVLFTQNEIVNIDAIKQEVFNVVGAGDSVLAGLAAGICIGLSIKNASFFANDLAGELVSRLSRKVSLSDSIKSRLLA
ncbi:MAG: rfaE bifunctional protein kinase chain/domain [Paracoccaceae bacterium]|jgi:rfaE bifunctional protein kinase chain/domain